MVRVLIAAAVLGFAAAPAFACPFHDSAAADTQSSTVASQPNSTPSAPPATTRQDKTPS